MTLELPIYTCSEANQRGTWKRHHKRRSRQRGTVRLALRAHLGRPPGPPVSVELTRVAPRKLDDDNLQGAFKHVRDGVADWLGIDDGDERVRWLYGQEKGPKRRYGIRIEVSLQPPA